MVLKKGGAKKSIKAKPKSALVIKAAAKKPKRMKEIILHEEWPQTEKLIKAEEKRGVLLEPERELVAKPEFEEITPEINSANGSKPGHLDPARFAKANARQAEQAWWVPAVAIFIRLSGWLLVPLIVGTTLGKWLDRKYETAPWLFLTTIGMAFIISMFGLIKNALEEFKKIEKSANDKNGTTGSGKN